MKILILISILLTSIANARTHKIVLAKNKVFGLKIENKQLMALGFKRAPSKLSLKEKKKIVSSLAKDNVPKIIQLYIMDFLPTNEKIPQIVFPKYSPSENEERIKSYCHRIGKNTSAFYTDGLKIKFTRAIVGEEKTECFGRCGTKCKSWYESRNIYTKQCFVHDVCHRGTGQQLGPCLDEFISASDDFLQGPKCE